MSGGARRITVVGLPAPQGSKSAFRNQHTGRMAVVESNPKKHKAWRDAVAAAASDWVWENHEPPPLDGPLRLRAIFYLPRPASYPKWRWLPDKKPDLSKLIRSTEDALSGIIYVDDARIVDEAIGKRYAIDRPPGAVIVVESLAEIERERGHAWSLSGGPPPRL